MRIQRHASLERAMRCMFWYLRAHLCSCDIAKQVQAGRWVSSMVHVKIALLHRANDASVLAVLEAPFVVLRFFTYQLYSARPAVMNRFVVAVSMWISCKSPPFVAFRAQQGCLCAFASHPARCGRFCGGSRTASRFLDTIGNVQGT